MIPILEVTSCLLKKTLELSVSEGDSRRGSGYGNSRNTPFINSLKIQFTNFFLPRGGLGFLSVKSLGSCFWQLSSWIPEDFSQ